MATQRDLLREVRKQGGTLANESSGRYDVYQCESPAGKVWNASGTHALRVEWQTGDHQWRNEAILDAVERMTGGTSPCDDDECDYCHAEGER